MLNMIKRQRGSYDGVYGYYYTYRPARAHRRLNDREVAATQVLQPVGQEPAADEPAYSQVTMPADAVRDLDPAAPARGPGTGRLRLPRR